jgi:hypothetical protein
MILPWPFIYSRQMDEPVCRFCLDEGGTLRNPLLLPCECKGSIAYVHKVCLGKWNRLDTFHDGICMLCKTEYHRYIYVFELIPSPLILQRLIVENPLYMNTLIHTLHFYIVRPAPEEILPFVYRSHCIFYALYTLVFAYNFSVNDREAYWQRLCGRKIFLLPLAHLYLFLLLPYPVSLGIIDTTVFIYWLFHKETLISMNREMLGLEA